MDDEGRQRTGRADEALIRALYQEHGSAMLAYATRLTGDRSTAEDVVQEALIKAWRHPESLVNGKGSLRGWLMTIVRNLSIDRARAVAVRPREVVIMTTTRDDGWAAHPDHAEQVVSSALVADLLATLSEQHRQVLSETYLRGRTADEAADRLGIPIGTVRSRSFYALRSLRRTLKGALPAY